MNANVRRWLRYLVGAIAAVSVIVAFATFLVAPSLMDEEQTHGD